MRGSERERAEKMRLDCVALGTRVITKNENKELRVYVFVGLPDSSSMSSQPFLFPLALLLSSIFIKGNQTEVVKTHTSHIYTCRLER